MIDDLVENIHSRKMLHDLRNPVDELKAFLTEGQKDVQKVQFFVRDVNERPQMMEKLEANFEGITVSCGLPQNVEINTLKLVFKD